MEDALNLIGITAHDRASIVAWAKKYPLIEAVYLYGSRAKGTYRPDSDVDLAIQMNGVAWYRWHQKFKSAPDLNLDGYKVHLQRYTLECDHEIIGAAIEREGVLLYERGALKTG